MAFSNARYSLAKAITLSDTVNFDSTTQSTTTTKAIPADAIQIGAAGATGTAVIALQDGTTVTLVGLIAGFILPLKCIRINSTTSTVTSCTAFYE